MKIKNKWKAIAIVSILINCFTLPVLAYYYSLSIQLKMNTSPQNSWIEDFKIILGNERKHVIGEDMTILNAEQPNQYATVQYQFYYYSTQSGEGISGFMASIEIWKSQNGVSYLVQTILSWQFISAPLHWAGQWYYSPKYGFYTPSTVDTYIMRITIGV